MTYDIHPLCQMLPELDEHKYRALKASMSQVGQIDPIILTTDGLVLDGRHRLRVCEENGIEPKVETWEGDPFAFWSAKLTHRDMKSSQRALIAADLSKDSEVGGDRKSDEYHSANSPNDLSRGKTATIMGVAVRSVTSASRILKSGEASVIKALRQGVVSVAEAEARVDEREKLREELEQQQALEGDKAEPEEDMTIDEDSGDVGDVAPEELDTGDEESSDDASIADALAQHARVTDGLFKRQRNRKGLVNRLLANYQKVGARYGIKLTYTVE